MKSIKEMEVYAQRKAVPRDMFRFRDDHLELLAWAKKARVYVECWEAHCRDSLLLEGWHDQVAAQLAEAEALLAELPEEAP